MIVNLTLKEFIESVMRSCLMNIADITPVYRIWGGIDAIEAIKELEEVVIGFMIKTSE